MRIPKRVSEWAYTLVGGMIGGGAGAVIQSTTFVVAKAAGDASIPAINFHMIGWLFIGGVLSHAFMFLAKSPLPPLGDETDTQLFSKNTPSTDEKTTV